MISKVHGLTHDVPANFVGSVRTKMVFVGSFGDSSASEKTVECHQCRQCRVASYNPWKDTFNIGYYSTNSKTREVTHIKVTLTNPQNPAWGYGWDQPLVLQCIGSTNPPSMQLERRAQSFDLAMNCVLPQNGDNSSALLKSLAQMKSAKINAKAAKGIKQKLSKPLPPLLL